MSIILDDKEHQIAVRELLTTIVKRFDTLIAIVEHGFETDIEIEIGDEDGT